MTQITKLNKTITLMGTIEFKSSLIPVPSHNLIARIVYSRCMSMKLCLLYLHCIVLTINMYMHFESEYLHFVYKQNFTASNEDFL